MALSLVKLSVSLFINLFSPLIKYTILQMTKQFYAESAQFCAVAKELYAEI